MSPTRRLALVARSRFPLRSSAPSAVSIVVFFEPQGAWSGAENGGRSPLTLGFLEIVARRAFAQPTRYINGSLNGGRAWLSDGGAFGILPWRARSNPANANSRTEAQSPPPTRTFSQPFSRSFSTSPKL